MNMEIVICSHYTMAGTSQQNGVEERHSRILVDIIRSMTSSSLFPKLMWMYSLKQLYIYQTRFMKRKFQRTLLNCRPEGNLV